MTLDRRVTLAATCMGLALAGLTGSAVAATKTVYAGTPVPDQRTFQNGYSVDVNAFFPRRVTIHQGDSVSFVPTEFHSVDFVRKGGRLVSLFTSKGKISGANDAAGNPFWFNGQPQPAFLQSFFTKTNYGKHVRYRPGLASGGPSDKPRPMVVRFANAGTFTYYCDIHPGMKGVVHVLRGRSHRRTQSTAKAVRAEVKRDLAQAKTVAKASVPAGQVWMGRAVKSSGVEYFGFLPQTTTVPAGTALTFRMGPSTLEIHTASFGPGVPEKAPKSYLGSLAKSFEGLTPNPIAFFSSEPPGSVATLNPSLHGNGFWSTGVLDRDAASPPPAAGTVAFDTPGTYDFYCLVHPFMHGVVKVT